MANFADSKELFAGRSLETLGEHSSAATHRGARRVGYRGVKRPIHRLRLGANDWPPATGRLLADSSNTQAKSHGPPTNTVTPSTCSLLPCSAKHGARAPSCPTFAEQCCLRACWASAGGVWLPKYRGRSGGGSEEEAATYSQTAHGAHVAACLGGRRNALVQRCELALHLARQGPPPCPASLRIGQRRWATTDMYGPKCCVGRQAILGHGWTPATSSGHRPLGAPTPTCSL